MLLVLALLTGCKPPPEAPAELDDLSRYLYREWSNDDEAVQAAGIVNLEAFLSTAGLTPGSDVDDRSWTLENLVEDDVASLPKRPDVPLDGMVAMSVAWDSGWPIDCHAALQTQVDQLPYEPSASDYVRSFPDVDDPACFVDGTCDLLATSNDVRRKNVLFAFTFVLKKDFRWIDFESADGETRSAFYSRSWLEQSWPGENGKTEMVQSYSIDLWMPRSTGRTWRYQVLWSETDLGADVSDDLQLGTIKGGTDTIMSTGDEAIGEQGLCAADRRIGDP